jgi:hypothetical protein
MDRSTGFQTLHLPIIIMIIAATQSRVDAVTSLLLFRFMHHDSCLATGPAPPKSLTTSQTDCSKWPRLAGAQLATFMCRCPLVSICLLGAFVQGTLPCLTVRCLPLLVLDDRLTSLSMYVRSELSSLERAAEAGE